MLLLPLHRAFFARATNQARRFATGILNWMYLACQTGRPGYTHVSTKLGKSVFRDKHYYYYVYRHINTTPFGHGQNPTSLLPANIINRRIFVYPLARAVEKTALDTRTVFELIDTYSAFKHKRKIPLGALLTTYFQRGIAREEIFNRVILSNFGASIDLNIGLCHCDLTTHNIVIHNERLRIIDWDDSCDFIPEYDKIYYCFMAKLNAAGKMNYRHSFEILGLKRQTFDSDLALLQLDSACDGRFTDLDYLLFLMMFAKKASDASPIASHLWSNVTRVVYKGNTYVR